MTASPVVTLDGYVFDSLIVGDSWQDDSRATQVDDRPRQLEALTQFMLTRWP